ncbi:LSM domain-containing protein [Methanobrevibacter sp. YE315]|uniref:LSM domain-containing protein n=1 Tax=Methanobrevibacter sp. YE315 TaxID=1609968 RepID=UPI000B0D0EC7|nr:LSM domain-containing protein [Methanobrevibacter sp. YE315]
MKHQNRSRIIKDLKKMSKEKENVNKLFRQFKNKYVTVDLRGDYQSEGKIIAIDNYLNLVLENENGLETVKGGNIIFISLKED